MSWPLLWPWPTSRSIYFARPGDNNYPNLLVKFTFTLLFRHDVIIQGEITCHIRQNGCFLWNEVSNKLDVFMKHGCPRRQQSQNMAKPASPTFWPHPWDMGCRWSVSKLYMNLQSKFGYCMTTTTLNIALCKRYGITDKRTNGQMDRQTDGQTDGQTIQTLDAPGGPFRPGAEKVVCKRTNSVWLKVVCRGIEPSTTFPVFRSYL